MPHDPSRAFRLLTAGLILFAAAGCTSPSHSAHSLNNIPIVTSDRKQPVVAPLVFNQLQPESRTVVRSTDHKISSIADGLSEVRSASKHPIAAVTEQEGWYFYATSVAAAGKAGQPPQFISGYAIKRGTREILYWSVW